MPLSGLPSVQLNFPKRCTPENISLFSGFMATIPHLMVHRAKERYNMDVDVQYVDRVQVDGKTTKGQRLTHAILAGGRRIAEVTEAGESRSDQSLPFYQSLAHLASPVLSSVKKNNGYKKRVRFDVESNRGVRSRKSAELRTQRRIRYANAISAWDRAKRHEAERTSNCRLFEGSISAIISGTPSVPQSPSSPTPPKWSSGNASVVVPSKQTTRKPVCFSPKLEQSLSFEKWASFDFPDADILDSSSFSWLTEHSYQEDSVSRNSSLTASRFCADDNDTSKVNQLLRDWYS